MEQHEEIAWGMVAEMLRAARAESAPGQKLPQFAESRGASRSLRVLRDLENAKRSNYDRQTLADVEVWYGLQAGQIRELLDVMHELDVSDWRRGSIENKARAAEMAGDLEEKARHLAERDRLFPTEVPVAHILNIMRKRRDTPGSEVVDKGVSDLQGRVSTAAEGAVGERASAVQVNAVREYIETMREALDRLEAAFEPEDGTSDS